MSFTANILSSGANINSGMSWTEAVFFDTDTNAIYALENSSGSADAITKHSGTDGSILATYAINGGYFLTNIVKIGSYLYVMGEDDTENYNFYKFNLNLGLVDSVALSFWGTNVSGIYVYNGNIYQFIGTSGAATTLIKCTPNLVVSRGTEITFPDFTSGNQVFGYWADDDGNINATYHKATAPNTLYRVTANSITLNGSITDSGYTLVSGFFITSVTTKYNNMYYARCGKKIISINPTNNVIQDFITPFDTDGDIDAISDVTADGLLYVAGWLNPDDFPRYSIIDVATGQIIDTGLIETDSDWSTEPFFYCDEWPSIAYSSFIRWRSCCGFIHPYFGTHSFRRVSITGRLFLK